MGLSLDTCTLQLILVAFSGSLLGEAVREVNKDTPLSFVHFTVEFMAGGFMALMVAIVLKVMVIKEEALLLLAFTGFLSFAGRKKSAAMAERLLIMMVSKREGDSDDSTEDKAENG